METFTFNTMDVIALGFHVLMFIKITQRYIWKVSCKIVKRQQKKVKLNLLT